MRGMSLRNAGQNDSFWMPAGRPDSLGADEVHIWMARLSGDNTPLSAMPTLMSASECARAERFLFDRDRSAYVVSRGCLRWLIGRYQSCDPSRIRLVKGAFGKPALATGDLQFSVSRSSGLGLFAFTRNREIGVDIERIKTGHASDQLARKSFSDWEYQQYAHLPMAQKETAFYRCWTRKEAYMKAIGRGLSYPLDAFDVSVIPGDVPRLERVEGSVEKARHWRLLDLPTVPGYASAVVASGRSWRLSCFYLYLES